MKQLETSIMCRNKKKGSRKEKRKKGQTGQCWKDGKLCRRDAADQSM